MRISDWSSDRVLFRSTGDAAIPATIRSGTWQCRTTPAPQSTAQWPRSARCPQWEPWRRRCSGRDPNCSSRGKQCHAWQSIPGCRTVGTPRSEEHTSELQSLMRISYAVFCLKKKNQSYREDNVQSVTIVSNTSDTPSQSISDEL